MAYVRGNVSMGEGQPQDLTTKALEPAPDDLLPHTRNRNLLDRFWSVLVPKAIPSDRPTVDNPTASPFGAVALLNFLRKAQPRPQYLGCATGFLIKPDLLLTAGHNLLYASADIVAVYPAWDDKLNRSQVVSATRWGQSGARDVGLLLVPPIHAQTIPLDGAIAPTARLVGYAFDYPDRTNRMSVGIGTCQPSGTALHYSIDAQQADSGGPVLSPSNHAMAIHRELLPGPHGTMLGGGEHIDLQVMGIIAQLEAQLRTR